MVHIIPAAYYCLTPPVPPVPLDTFPWFTADTAVQYGWLDSSSWTALAKYGFENGLWQYFVHQSTGLNLPIPTMDSGLKHVADICFTWVRASFSGLTGVADAPLPTKAMYPFRVIDARYA